MKTEAQNRAKTKYKEKVKVVRIELYPTEPELIDHIEKQANKQGYIKNLIKEDMKKEQV